MKLLNEEELHHLVNELSQKFFKKPFSHDVRYNQRLRTTGGRYIPSLGRIELNPKYAVEMDRNEFCGIIKHELCHYHLHIEGKGYKHGDREFKELLRATGSPRYCKPLPSSFSRYKHQYTCSKCRHIYKRVRKIDLNKYRCGKCKGQLEHTII
jgi:SprT-like protein